MSEIQDTNPPINFERFALIYAPLLVAWWIGIASVEKQLGNLLYAGIIVTVVISIVFVLVRKIEITIYNGKEKSAAIKYLVLGAIPLFITFACNLNAIYPAIMAENLLREELEEKRYFLKMAGEEAAKNLTDVELNIWKKKIDGLVGQLETQINSPFNRGVGALSEKILKEIEKELGQDVTRHKYIAKGREKEIAEKYRDDITNLRNRNTRQEKHAQQEIDLVWIKGEIDKALTGKNGLESALLLESKSASQAQVLLALKEASNVYNEVVIRTIRHVPTSFSNVPHKITVVNAELGKLSHTFESASAHLQNKGTWVAIFFSLLIDLWAIVLAFWYTAAKVQLRNFVPDRQAQLGSTRLFRLQ